ncbi:uncharacterized protein LOC128219944 [Mya arenaria]|uniref:uncharacterized protein LOC128219944 n=1 Tax=Mya arenaria TaxID=6604 RepID=UPI0022E792A5|nr:uncharacterized protein LOC128219944 [Mya arenaria]XP_052784105.1 uncharacterized protein LOC128219944 [Mya arenaria]XP_052784114.1 uncharacterized protein LOC128219944 [Mya arenaria]
MGNSTHKECVDSGFLMTRPVRTRITPRNVNSLKEGDHITWHRTYGIWHHANVVKTFSSGQIEVRHFASDRTGLKAKAIIQNKVVDPLKENGILYRINNSSIPGGNSAELVVARTRGIESISDSMACFPYTMTEEVQTQLLKMKRCLCEPETLNEYRGNDNNLLGVICGLCDQEWLRETRNTRKKIIFQGQEMGKYNYKEFVDSGFLMTRPERTEITQWNVGSLGEGDHITWERTYDIWHHAIVVKIFLSGQIEICHFDSDNERKKTKAIIKTKEINPLKENGTLYRINYSNIPEENSAALVVARTKYFRSLPTISKSCYNLFKNNCENFATYCKTGTSISYQVEWLKSRVEELIADELENIPQIRRLVIQLRHTRYGGNDLFNRGGDASLLMLSEVRMCYKDIVKIISITGMSDEDRSREIIKRISQCVGGVVTVGVGSYALGSFKSKYGTLVAGPLELFFGKIFGAWVGGRIARSGIMNRGLCEISDLDLQVQSYQV